MLIRPREAGDVPRLVELVLAVREVDRYPLYLPEKMDEFLVSPDAIAAWVAEVDGIVVGQVALHRSTVPEVMAVAREATGLQDHELAAVARLVVSVDSRRAGVGRALFETAWAEAARRGLRAILDVVLEHGAAVELYRRAGWREAGTVTWHLPMGPLTEHVFVSPESPGPADGADQRE